MTDIISSGITELCVSGCLIARIHPLIIWLVDGRTVMPSCLCCKISFVLRQVYFHCPERTGHQIVGRYITAYASVGFLAGQVIDRCTGSRSMTDNAEVKFDTAGSPRPTHGNITELHDMVVINKFLLGSLIHCSPYLPSYFGKKSQFDIVIFKCHHFPLFIHPFSGKAIKTKIGIEQVGRISHRIRIGEWIGFNRLYTFRNSSLLLCR